MLFSVPGTSTGATAAVAAAAAADDGLQSVDGGGSGWQWIDGREQGVSRGNQRSTLGTPSAATTARDSGTDKGLVSRACLRKSGAPTAAKAPRSVGGVGTASLVRAPATAAANVDLAEECERRCGCVLVVVVGQSSHSQQQHLV